MEVPFTIYADFESLIQPINTTQMSQSKSYANKLSIHKPMNFSYYVRCTFHDSYSKIVKHAATSEEEDVSQMFLDGLVEEAKSIYDRFK